MQISDSIYQIEHAEVPVREIPGAAVLRYAAQGDIALTAEVAGSRFRLAREAQLQMLHECLSDFQ